MGAAETVAADAAGGAGAVVREWSGGGVDAAIEISGSDRALHEAVRSVVVEGLVVASGFYQGGAANLRLGEEFHHNRVRIVASQISGHARGSGRPVGPAAPGAHVHGPGPRRTRRRGVTGHRRRRGSRRGRGLRTTRPRRPRHPPGRAAVPGRPVNAAREGLELDTGPRFPEDRSGVAILGCGTIAQSAHLPAYEQHGVGVTGVWSRSADDDGDRARAVPLRRPRLRQRRGAAGRPRGAVRRPGHRSRGTAHLDRGRHRGGQARAGPEAADPLGRRPGPASGGARQGRRRRRPGRRQPQRPLGAALAGHHAAAAAGRDRRGRRRHAPARQATAAAGGDAVRRRAAHAAHRLPPALGRHHPHAGPSGEVGRRCRRPTHGSRANPPRPGTRGRPRSR